ncbi:MAG: hypothetical protein HYX72_13600 [Acidobacteria bacterium]|nr:hypothetical protein [Acidobacteriota bacterium]
MNARRSYYAVSHLDGRHLCAPAAESILNNDGAAWLPFTGFSTGGTAVPFTYTPQHRAVLAIFNERGSDAVVRIDEIRLLPLMGKGSTQGTGIAPPTFRIARLTDLSGGELIFFRKLDTANADLPPQVFGCINPSGSTLGETIFWKPEAPLWTRSMIFPVSLASRNSAASAWSGAAAIIAGYAESRCQRVILREGEGISVTTLGGASDWALNRPVAITITLRTQAGECYMASRSLSSGAGAGNESGAYPFFALFNGVGSGLVLEVVGITVQEIRDALEMPVYTLEFIEGLEGGDDLVATPADSAYPALPAGIVVRGRLGPSAGDFPRRGHRE